MRIFTTIDKKTNKFLIGQKFVQIHIRHVLELIVGSGEQDKMPQYIDIIMFGSFINYPIGSLTLRATQIHGEVCNVIATEFRSDKYYSECHSITNQIKGHLGK